jgi:hypothetical protein
MVKFQVFICSAFSTRSTQNIYERDPSQTHVSFFVAGAICWHGYHLTTNTIEKTNRIIANTNIPNIISGNSLCSLFVSIFIISSICECPIMVGPPSVRANTDKAVVLVGEGDPEGKSRLRVFVRDV